MIKSHILIVSIVLTLSGVAAATGAPPVDASINWQCWQKLAVQNGGRQKPLDTLSWETLRATSNLATVIDSDTGKELNSTALYLTLFFEWNGWDHERKDSLTLSKDLASQYAYFHQADRWDKTALLRVDHPGLHKMLGMPERVRFIAPAVLTSASIVDPRSQQNVPFPTWGRILLELKEAGNSLTPVEKKGLELAERLLLYQGQRMGMGFEVLPNSSTEDEKWLSIGELLVKKFDDANDTQGQYRHAQNLLREARTAFRNEDSRKFNALSQELCGLLRTVGSESASYPSEFTIDLEVAYNHWSPFRYAWMMMLLAALGMLLNLGSGWRSFYRGAVGCYALGLMTLAIGFSMRIMISGRPPVTNMYESVIYVGFGVAIFGAIFESIYRKKYVLMAAAAVSTVALIMADNCPAVLDPGIRPLEPVLRSNFWLVTHVMTIALSYAAFALALGISNMTLGYYLVGSKNVEAIRALSQFTYRAIQIGVLLLAAGIILGGVWADYSWGRFWGWDPKEVWALVALLGYLAVLHARFAGAVGHRGLAALSIVCFSLVVMAWYGVNFMLGAGLHSYGFGGGGQGVVYLAVFLQWLYAGIAIRRSWFDPVVTDLTSKDRQPIVPQIVTTDGTIVSALRG